MQHGESHVPVVSFVCAPQWTRGSYATFVKQKANRTHRHRVKQNMKQIANSDVEDNDFDGTPDSPGERASGWDLW